MEFNHYSVMLTEVIEELNIKPDGIYLDGTLGGAGHSSEISAFPSIVPTIVTSLLSPA